MRSINACSRHDFSREGVLTLRCGPVLVPTMLPGGSAADTRVRPSISRVPDIHLGGHLIARFAFLEQSKDISLGSTRHIGLRYNCTEWVPYIVGGQVACYLRFSHVMS